MHLVQNWQVEVRAVKQGFFSGTPCRGGGSAERACAESSQIAAVSLWKVATTRHPPPGIKWISQNKHPRWGISNFFPHSVFTPYMIRVRIPCIARFFWCSFRLTALLVTVQRRLKQTNPANSSQLPGLCLASSATPRLISRGVCSFFLNVLGVSVSSAVAPVPER